MLSIIIPTYDRPRVLKNTLLHISEAIQGIECEVIIINDSKDSYVENLHINQQIVVFDNPKQGVASARNLGAAYARGEYLLFVDDDILVSKQNLISCLDYMNKYQRRCYLFNWYYPQELITAIEKTKFGRFLIKFGWTSLKGWMGDDWIKDETIFKIPMGASYFLPISKRNFEDIGGYNEHFPYAGAEDREFCQRAIKHGISFYLDTTETVLHNESDRITIKHWMLRKKRNGKTQRVLSEMEGNKRYTYSKSKRASLEVLSRIKILIWLAYYIIPNHKVFDAITSRITNLLLTINIFEGYNGK